jgi:hypothetical protein
VPLIVLDKLYNFSTVGNGTWVIIPDGYIMGQRTPNMPESRVLQAEQEDIFTLRPARRIDWGEVIAIEVQFGVSTVPYDLVSLRLETSNQGDHWILFDEDVNITLQPGQTISKPIGPFGPQKPEDVLTDEELCCVERLMQHLGDNKLHYNRAIWLAEDRDVRAEWLDLYSFDSTENRGVS